VAGASPSLTEQVLAGVERIPPGKVMSYSDVAEFVGTRAARNIGRILATEGGSVPWHRVVRQDGSCAEHIRDEQLALLRSEGVPIRGQRVNMTLARWNGR
jgi:alkylated DNA nucleotide flippase Atl1